MFGRFIKTKTRCDYCHIPHPQTLIVESGECTGKFCSRNHYDLALQHKRTNKVPEHDMPKKEVTHG